MTRRTGERHEPAVTGPSRRRTVAVLVVAAAPLVWALHLGVSYWLVPVACEAGTNLPIHLATGVGLLASLAIVVYGHRMGPGRQRRADTAVAVASVGDELEHASAAALAPLATILGAYFGLVIAVTGLVAVILGPCT